MGSDVLDEALVRLAGFGPEFGGGFVQPRPDGRGGARPPRPTRKPSPVGSTTTWPASKTQPGRAAECQSSVTCRPSVIGSSSSPASSPSAIGTRSCARGCLGWHRALWRRRLTGGCAPPMQSVPYRDHETSERLAELGRGLAYWAARYQEIPGPTKPSGTLSVASGIAALPNRRTAGDGLIFEAVRRSAAGDLEFVAAVNAVDGSSLDVDGLLRRGRCGDRRQRSWRHDRLRPHVDANGGDPFRRPTARPGDDRAGARLRVADDRRPDVDVPPATRLPGWT